MECFIGDVQRMTYITEEEIYQKYGLVLTDMKMFYNYQIPLQYALALKNTNLEDCIKKVTEFEKNSKIVDEIRKLDLPLISQHVRDSLSTDTGYIPDDVILKTQENMKILGNIQSLLKENEK